MNRLNNTLNIPQTISLAKAAELLSITERTVKEYCRTGKFKYTTCRCGKKLEYKIDFFSLPEHIQNKFLNKDDDNYKKYSEAPMWAKSQVEKYLPILKETTNLKGSELEKYISNWNSKNKDNAVSYSSLIKMRRRYQEDGISGLLANYGTNSSKSTVSNELFDYFKNLYLVEGAPSLYSCWEQTRGYANRELLINRLNFPSYMAFKRKLEQSIPAQAIFLARNGQSAWNRKFGNYIDRDYSNITCGKVWVSDHAQIDVACLTNDGDVVFPWVTAWRDYKSGKWLGWILQTGSPNSDLIFQSFYYAAEKYGLPEDVIIDNGKDYRCKDFAGGRKNIKIESNKNKTTSMLAELNVNVHFALPYNAQTKPIERDFLKIKELLSKHCVGYRGGNVVERPEKLIQEIKKGKILPFDKFKRVFDDFIINILNKKPSIGKNLKGLSPDELFNQEYKEKVTTSRDALKLFCMRTSKNFTIRRNGIKDTEFGITYWADWMIHSTGMKVYLRRDVQNYKEAWAFNSDDNEFIGKVDAVRAVAALHALEVSKEEFKSAMSNKKRNLKIAKSYIQQTREISIEEQCENYKAAYASIERSSKTTPKVSKIANTNMDKAIRKAKEMDEYGKQDLSFLLNGDKTPVEQSLYLYETDRILAEGLEGVANGY